MRWILLDVALVLLSLVLLAGALLGLWRGGKRLVAAGARAAAVKDQASSRSVGPRTSAVPTRSDTRRSPARRR